eukprot:1006785-Pleurochrysis_carterae.AAC.1
MNFGLHSDPPPLPLFLPVQGVIAGKGKQNSADAKRCRRLCSAAKLYLVEQPTVSRMDGTFTLDILPGLL